MASLSIFARFHAIPFSSSSLFSSSVSAMGITMIACPNPFRNTRCQRLSAIFTCSRQQSVGTFNNSSPRSHYPRHVPVIRERPKPECLKLNFDGGVSGGSAGCGYVLRDSRGEILAAGYQKTRNLDVVDAELRGLLHGLQMAVKVCDRGQKICIEGDSLKVITGLKNSFQDSPMQNHPVAQDILRLLPHVSEVQASHIYREENRVADWLAKKAKKGKASQEATEWFANVPAKLQKLADRDLHKRYLRNSKVSKNKK